ncbi:hypothetical protein BH20ACT5_BH20ACT5_14140 [soil metagenome]
MYLTELAPHRVVAAKAAYTTRRVDLGAHRRLALVTGIDVVPRTGDLVLARVGEIGQHERVELATGRRAALYTGDEVIVAYGGRYAPDQFEADVPPDLSGCQLVAGGGLAARVVNAHLDMEEATELTPAGLIADSTGRVINVKDGAIPSRGSGSRRPLTLVVAGTSMNSGKTTTVAAIAHGLTAAGRRTSLLGWVIQEREHGGDSPVHRLLG